MGRADILPSRTGFFLSGQGLADLVFDGWLLGMWSAETKLNCFQALDWSVAIP